MTSIKFKAAALVVCITLALASSSTFGFMNISKFGTEYTFTFDPPQSAPLAAGFASYSSGTGGPFHGLFWAGSDTLFSQVVINSNTLIDNTGAPVPDSALTHIVTDSSGVVITGFGNNGTPFTVAGGSLVFGQGTLVTELEVPSEDIAGFAFGTSYDPGTTGTSGDLTPVPEPGTYAALAGLAALAFVVVCRRK